MERQPGKWIGNEWICGDQPADTPKKYYYCCPTGYRYKTARGIQKVRTSRKVRLNTMDCPGEDPMILACGPKPTGNVKCCPRTQQWISAIKDCPIPDPRRGLDIEFLQRLNLPFIQQAGPGKQLLIIGIPIALIVIGMIVAIIRL